MNPEPVTDYIITPHAFFEMKRREIGEQLVRLTLAKPEQRLAVRLGRVILQSKIKIGGSEKKYLIRVFVDIDRHPAEVVTAYLTSKISKYWREI